MRLCDSYDSKLGDARRCKISDHAGGYGIGAVIHDKDCERNPVNADRLADRKIDPKFYANWRAYGETASHAAFLALGSTLIANEDVEVIQEYDPEGCQCDYPAIGPCHFCQDNRERYGNYSAIRHKCACPYTMEVTVRTPDREYVESLGGICVNSDSDPYLDYCAAELAGAIAARMDPTPSSWMAL